MAISAESCRVALLGRDDGARRQLRDALQELGASIAFEGEPSAAPGPSALGGALNVVIVNLEEGLDDTLDHLQAVLDDPEINVVFNDADVSRSLEGWDLARWARHLAAKVLGHGETMPPVPEGAGRLREPVSLFPDPGAVPTPAELVPEPDVTPFIDEALDISGTVPVDALPEVPELSRADTGEFSEEFTAAPAGAREPPQGAGAALDIDFDLLSDALSLADAPAPELLAPTPGAVDAAVLADEALGDAQIERALALDAEAPARETSSPDAEMVLAATEELAEFNWDFGEEAPSDAPAPAVGQDGSRSDGTGDRGGPEHSGSIEFADPASRESTAQEDAAAPGMGFDAEAWSLDDGAGENDADSAGALDDEVAALAAQLDAFETTDNGAALEELDFSAFDAPADIDASAPVAAANAEPASAARVPVAGGGLELALASLDEGVTLAESDSATGAEAKPTYDFGDLDKFSLEPIEEEEVDPLMVAMGLVEAPASAVDTATAATAADASPLGHVFVLGASIGGPDAVRIFLSELPANLPAVFLLVQHLESGYFERLAQQLQKASALLVRIASAAVPAKKGEVLVIPATEHVVLEADGSVVARPHEKPPRYTPSIDTVLQDVADRFGSKATAIIFSGMAGDAVEGAAYLTTKGGEVWAQDPESCVVSSMVDGARARGVVEFTGSPRELAQRCVARVAR